MKIRKYLEESPVFAINSTYEAMIPKINRQLKQDNLNLLQGLVLTALFFEDRDDISPSQLAALFRTSRGNMSHIISHLEYHGFIKRVLNLSDARSFRIELKAEGKKRAISLIKFYDRLQNIFEKKLGEEFCRKTVSGIHSFSTTFKESK